MIKTYDNFLSDDECDKYINLIEEMTKYKGPTFNNLISNFNRKFRDSAITNDFYNKYLLHEKNMNTNVNITGCNDVVMVAKYNSNQSFGLHTDTGLCFDRINKIKTTHTVLIYLNDDFKNGETVFYHRGENNEIIKTSIKPKRGMMLLFDIDLLHEGKEVNEGNKYWIGCEFIGKML